MSVNKAQRNDFDRDSRDAPQAAQRAAAGEGETHRRVDGQEAARLLEPAAAPVQRRQTLASALSPEATQQTATAGVQGAGESLPFAREIQASFGGHDVGGVRAHLGSDASAASAAIGARAYATGNDVAFGGAPDLHTAAHEAAHVVQQRGQVQLKGGVGEVGDRYEQHADAVADRVVQGGSAVALLDQMAPRGAGSAGGVQMLQLLLADDLRTAADAARVTELIAAAPLEEVTALSTNTTLIRQVEARLGAGADAVRARLARRLFIDGHQPVQAFALITGDDRLRRQRYLDLYGTLVEQRTFLDAVIADGSNVGYMIRAFDSYWNVEALRQDARGWEPGMIQRVHAQLKALPEQDARTGIWRQIALIRGSGGSFSDPSDPTGRFEVGRDAFDGRRGTTLAAAAPAAATEVTVGDVTGLTAGDRVTVGAFPSPDIKRVTAIDVAAKKLTLRTPLGLAHAVGEVVTPTSGEVYGVGTSLTAVAPAGQREITVGDASVFAVGATVAMDRAGSADVKQVASIDAAASKYTLNSDLTREYRANTPVVPNDATGSRAVDWLAAVVRHEIAHAVDSQIHATGFYDTGGWWTGEDFDTWATAMGNPWRTSDGSDVPAADHAAIRNHIVAGRGNQSARPLSQGLPSSHAVRRFYDRNVPVIEAAKACTALGDAYWQTPTVVKNYGGKRFAISFYYNKFQYFNEQVHASRVRDYQTYSPAEFFAEIYTVYYEEKGRPGVNEADFGRLVPVGTWRDWIRNNVHNRGLAPAPGVGGAAGVGRPAGRNGM